VFDQRQEEEVLGDLQICVRFANARFLIDIINSCPKRFELFSKMIGLAIFRRSLKFRPQGPGVKFPEITKKLTP
jgi:hypothetical protein